VREKWAQSRKRIPCKHCGKEFTPTQENKVYCCVRCRDDWQRKDHAEYNKKWMREKKAEYRLTNPPQKRGRKPNPEKRITQKSEYPKTANCVRYGQEYQQKKHNHYYCTDICCYEAHKDSKKKWQKKELTCRVCGKAFFPNTSNQIYCESQACKDKASGEKQDAYYIHKKKHGEIPERKFKFCDCGREFIITEKFGDEKCPICLDVYTKRRVTTSDIAGYL
jgi:hypothetical protein